MEHEPQKLKIKIKFKTHNLNDEIVRRPEPDERISGNSSVFKKQGNNISNSKVCCYECLEEFSSSQVLGGHMRIHAQLHKKKDDQNYLLKPSDHHMVFKKQENVFNVNEPVGCSVCGKTFRSMKSLFGHMRSHPGREWPLSNKLDDGDVVTDNDDGCGDKEVMGLGSNLVTWSTKARRGGKGTRGGSSDGGDTGSLIEEVEDEEEKKLRNAVMDLLMLKELDSFQATTSHAYVSNTCREIVLHESMNVLEESNEKDNNKNNKRRRSVEEEDDSPKSMLTTTQVISSSSTDYGSEKDYYPIEDYSVLERGTTSLVEYFAGKESDGQKDELALTNKTNNDNKCFEEENNRKKKSKLMVMNTDYKCSRCDKCFTSHQALGGHVSSHNKLRNNNYSIINQHHQDQASSVPLHCESVHACRICKKTFGSGQALGGHMRCHWPSPILQFAQEPSTNQAQLAPVPGEEVDENAGSRRQLLDFDLNEIPPMEEDI